MLDLVLRESRAVTRLDVRSVADGFQIIKGVLEEAGACGKWLARATAHVQWRADCRFCVRRYDYDQRRIVVRTKPGDNSTVWEFDLTAPHNIDRAAFDLLYAMMSVSIVSKSGEVRHEHAAAVASAANGHFKCVDKPASITLPVPEPEPFSLVVEEEEGPQQEIEQVKAGDLVQQPRAIAGVVPEPLPMGDMTKMMAKLGAITQRVCERDRQRNILTERKKNLEDQIEKLMVDLQETEEMVKHIASEEEQDAEATMARQFMGLFNQSMT